MGNQRWLSRKKRHASAPLWGVVILIVVVSAVLVDTTRADSDNFYGDIIRLDNVATKIHQNYVEELQSKKLVDKAVEGMLGILDPHTSYFENKQFEELRIHTEGKFGGLGIQISIRDKVLTVMTPIAGTPAARAGIQSGDQILEIDGKTTKGIKLDAAVSKLRGDPGTKVTILIRRKGEDQPLTYTLTREIIKINPISFSGVIDSAIGYIRIAAFSQETGDELGKAIRELLRKKMKSLIIDLRDNPGGLLPEAIGVASNFLPSGALVVSTRGRAQGQNKEFKVVASPSLPKEIPLIVLVNYASASASEIVAGAIQDWDRGVVLGDTTFGKGSVQTILPLDKDHHLKLTTAFYYTPSGRCINRPENDVRGREDVSMEDTMSGETQNASDSAGAAADTASKMPRDTTVYRTKGMRIVYGGGGIVPDTVVERQPISYLIRSLFMKDVFFQFANAIHPRLQKKKTVIDAQLQISDGIMKEFRAFLDTIKFEYKSVSDLAFERFLSVSRLQDTVRDTADVLQEAPQWSVADRKELLKMAERIKAMLRADEESDFRRADAEIRKYIKEALLLREYGLDHEIVVRYRLADDNQVQTAVALLLKPEKYKKLLAP